MSKVKQCVIYNAKMCFTLANLLHFLRKPIVLHIWNEMLIDCVICNFIGCNALNCIVLQMGRNDPWVSPQNPKECWKNLNFSFLSHLSIQLSSLVGFVWLILQTSFLWVVEETASNKSDSHSCNLTWNGMIFYALVSSCMKWGW